MSTPTVPLTVTRTIAICEFMNSLDKFTPREFMVTFLSSNHPDLVYRRRQMKAGQGGKQTRSIVKNLARWTASSPQGQAEWEEIILDEASTIVNTQEVSRGVYPKGGYVSSNQITPDFFSDTANRHREMQMKTGMPFIHTLIHRKISGALAGRTHVDTEDYKDDPAPSQTTPGDPDSDDVAQETALLAMDNLVYVKPTPANQAEHKLARVPTMVCQMIAVACNRRSNAISLANGIMALAGGVTCRVNEWLHSLGLTTSRSSVLSAIDNLRILQENRLMNVFKVNQKLLPLLCYDNVDIQLKIHNTRIETSSRLFHGTWGFFMVIRSCLLARCPKEAMGLATFLKAMDSADRKPVKMSLFCPTETLMEPWKFVIKAQLAKALTEYIAHLPGELEPNALPKLQTKPPAVDPIAMHKPIIHFLKMMDAPDNSADGVTRVLDLIADQIGMSSDQIAENLLIAAGDVGSNQLVESLRVKRFPPIDTVEGFEWILSVFGGAHTTWNIAKAFWIHHWGNSALEHDTGVWRTAFSLGLEYKKPPGSQDYNTIMRSCQIVHKANLVFVISEGIKSMKDIDLTKTADCEKLFDRIWTDYFAETAIETAKGKKKKPLYNFLLRLRDFATVVEAHESTRAGDIGRLLAVWKRWSVMAQGLPGLSHYSRHIPRIVMLLEEDLPKHLAHAIKHSLLIPSNERDDHWLALDDYLEINIGWLKDHYNNTGRGTDLARLINRLSNQILMLRTLMQLIKAEAGQKIIYQRNLNTITPASMDMFLKYAAESLADIDAHRPPVQITNAWKEGVVNMVKLIRADKIAGRASRFRWGASDVLSSWVGEDEADED